MNTPVASHLQSNKNRFAEEIVTRIYARHGEIWRPYGSPGLSKSLRDAIYHLEFLAEALALEDQILFDEYVAWVKVLFDGLHFPPSVLPDTLATTREVLQQMLPADLGPSAVEMLEKGLKSLEQATEMPETYLAGDSALDEMARQYLDALLAGERQQAAQIILQAVQRGISIKSIYLQVFQRTQREIGRLWQTNQISVAQEHYCSAATQVIMSQLYPYIFTGRAKDHSIVVACVGGELHEIGARMVADLLEMEGWDTHFLGANTPTESILHTLRTRQAEVLALSATLTTHVSQISEVITEVRCKPELAGTRILVGGLPFNLSPGLWQKVGADAFAADAERSILAANEVLGG